MRGTPGTRTPHGILARIIPAYAGNTDVWSRRATVSRDHPRVCGEHVLSDEAFVRSQGSSPRMRGTLSRSAVVNPQVGIIPAYAGNTYWKLHELYVRRDHPRVCGEHYLVRYPKCPQTGSSPRMRGTPRLHQILGGELGIIPAYAGNTVPRMPLMVCNWDHPRVCGEHTKRLA